ncbi:MAG: hypothetical protein KGH99_06525 [Thaumarchaeota archaeon]|nr:hypothetical protein [Candidatus Nitrosotalea sp.]MDE1873113.1 hypothetical protein [Nitrososphaerota archaeon]
MRYEDQSTLYTQKAKGENEKMKIQNNKTKTYLVVGLSLVAMLAYSSSLSAVFAQEQSTVPEANKELAKKIETIIDQMQSTNAAAQKASDAGDHENLKKHASDYESLKMQLVQAMNQLPKHKILNMTSTKVTPKDLTVDPNFNISGGHYGCDFNWDGVSGSGSVWTGTPWLYVLANAAPSVSTGIWPYCTTNQFANYATVTVTNLWTGTQAQSGGYASTTSPLVNQYFNYPPTFVSGDPYAVTVTSYYAHGNTLQGVGYVNP